MNRARPIFTLLFTLIILLPIRAQIINLDVTVWSKIGGVNKPFNVNTISTGDINGDGILDFVSQPNILNLGNNQTYFNTTTNDWSVSPTYVPHNRQGLLGDHNGDGKKDVVEILNNQIAVFHGSALGLPSSPSQSFNLSNCDGCGADFSFDANGDINNDGYDDLVIGAPFTSHFSGNRGSVLIVYGSNTGLNFNSIVEITRPYIGTFWGKEVRFGGDINKDGFDDILVATESFSGQNFDERVYVIYGKTGVLAEPMEMSLGGRETEGYAHEIGAAGDINGDGFADFYISAYERNNYAITSRGTVEIVYGKGNISSGFSIVELYPPNINEVNSFGGSVCSVGDFNNDGFSDLAVTNNDKVLIYLGSRQGLADKPRYEYQTATNAVVRYAGDIDKDGFSDLFVSQQEFNFGGGRIQLLRGRTSMIPKFGVSEREICASNATAIFRDSSIEAVSYLWDFGDGTASTEQNPKHTYTRAGIFTVKLTTKNALGHSWSMIKDSFVIVRPPLASGSYTIGEGGDFRDIYLVNNSCKCGILGNVSLRFKNGLYTPPTLLLENVDTRGFTLTFESETGNQDSVILGEIWRYPYQWVSVPDIIIKNSKNIVFKNITIKKYYAAKEPNVQISNSENIKFQNCRFINDKKDTFIVAERTKNLAFDSCVLGLGFPFMHVKGSSDLSVIRSYPVLEPNNAVDNLCYISIDSTRNVLASDSKILYFNIRNSENIKVQKNRNIDFDISDCQKVESTENAENFTFSLKNSAGIKIHKNKHLLRGFYNLTNVKGIDTEGYNLLSNNIIVSAYGDEYSAEAGISLTNCNNLRVYHNSIIYPVEHPSECKGANLRVKDCDSIDVRNNLFSSNPVSYCAFLQIENNTRYTANFNAYCNGIYFNTDIFNFHSLLKFEEFKTTIGQDANSIVGEMRFIEDKITPLPETVGLIHRVAPLLNQVTEDINGKVRSPNGVDIGAEEFDFSNYYDFSLDSLKNETLSIGNNALTVRFTNRSSSKVDSCRLVYQLDNNAVVHEKWIGSLHPFSTFQYSFTTPLSIPKGRVYTLKIWLENASEGTRTNDTLRRTFSVPMIGDYVVGNANSDYTTFIAFYKDLAKAGMQGDVNLTLQNGKHTHKESDIDVESRGAKNHWLILKGQSSDPSKVQFSYSTLTQPYVRFENLTIETVNQAITQENFGSQLLASKVEIKDCLVQSEANTAEEVFDFKVLSDTSLIVKNTTFKNLKEALDIVMVQENNEKKLHIENCRFSNIGVGIRCQNYNLTDLKIIKNIIDTAQIGIYIVGIGSDTRDTESIKTIIAQNKIVHCQKAGIAGAAIYYCLIANNFIQSDIHAIELTNTKVCKIINNSCFGTFYYDQNDFGTYVLNNSFVAIDTPFYGSLYHREDLGLFYHSNFNNYFSLNNKPFKIIHHNDNDRLEEMSLERFKQYYSTDNNSISVNPRYESTIDMHIDTNSPLNGAGGGVYFGVNTDYDGQERDSTKNDIGADEIKTPSVVMPGDANFDGIVNTLDLLPIAVAIPQQLVGIPRPNTSIEWLPQASINWAAELLGKNAKHADTNGDGSITVNDTLAVSRNYSKTHIYHLRSRSASIPLFFTDLSKNTTEGSIVTAKIQLGTDSQKVKDIYGVFFSLQYDTSKIVKGSMNITFDSIWIAPKENRLTMVKNFDHVDIGIVRTDGLNIKGWGAVANIQFQVKNATFGKASINLINGQIFSNNGVRQDAFTTNDSIIIHLKVKPSINVLFGTSQITPINKPFNLPLKIQVKDGNGKIMPNVLVKFVLPEGNVPSAIFKNGFKTYITTTNTEGIAQSLDLTANNYVGSYFVNVLLEDGTFGNILLANTPVTSLIEVQEESLFIYPNPANDKVVIEKKSSQSEGGYLRLYNTVGILLHEAFFKDNSIEWNTSHLPNGIYFIQYYTDNGLNVITLKLSIYR